jgi:hypothetical protein
MNTRGLKFVENMIVLLGIFMTAFGSMSVAEAADRDLQKELTALSREKESLESEQGSIAAAFEMQVAQLARTQQTVGDLLAQKDLQNQKIEAHLQALMTRSAEKKGHRGVGLFDKTNPAKECLSRAAVAVQCETLHRDQQKLTELKATVQQLTKDNQVMAQKMSDRQGLISQISQKQQALYQQVEEGRKVAHRESASKSVAL